MIITWTLTADPSKNYLECNGQAVDAAKYPKLYALMHNTPDYRGVFLRGYGSQNSYHWKSTQHSSANLGELQGDAIRNIYGGMDIDIVSLYYNTHGSGWGAIDNYATGNSVLINGGGTYSPNAAFKIDASRVVPTANENRPVNKAVRYFIKAK